MITGFMTGSRVYGTPSGDSDLDLCLLVTREELSLLQQCCDVAEENHARNETYPPDHRVLRFGNLNVLCFVHGDTESDFFSFALGTVKMKSSGIVGTANRDIAVALFQKFMGETPAELGSGGDT